MRAYEEIIDLIAAGTTPAKVIAFRPSPETKLRVGELIRREKTAGLSAEETSELDHYLELEHLMRLAKARALRYAAHE
ncbi:MAG: hypothetical protein GY862_37645 [Gammaproteobacteria bacterium]|nr:hypothetical protein [Gammaproteobacteria bacterium]